MSKDFYEAMKLRRSHYDISNEQVIEDDKLVEMIEYVVKHTPSAFNSQTARIVLLLGDEHIKLWDITKDALKEILDDSRFPETEKKINSFSAGYGTILFFEDTKIVKDLQEQFTTYKDNFSIWSKEASGMHQYNIWTALRLEGYGASLQHYNELIEDKVRDEWNIDESWEMRAQMPFGKPRGDLGEKEFANLEDRVKVYK